jgi:hypothetical protein
MKGGPNEMAKNIINNFNSIIHDFISYKSKKMKKTQSQVVTDYMLGDEVFRKEFEEFCKFEGYGNDIFSILKGDNERGEGENNTDENTKSD